ncbi:MAG: 30S ribosomal protein S11 [Parcubacteria group bacterium]|jgi:small subunit ribosomal protein S11
MTDNTKTIEESKEDAGKKPGDVSAPKKKGVKTESIPGNINEAEATAPKEGDEKDEEKAALKKKKKKVRRQVLKGQVHVQCTYNNTIVAFSDLGGKILAWCSAGSLGFKGAKKATPYAATQIVNTAAEKVSKYGLREVEVYVKGVGSGREASIRALANNDFEITSIKDITPIPHNGCRPRKPRRV